MSRAIKLSVIRGYGSYLGNLIELLSGKATAELKGEWIEVEEVSPGHFRIIGNSLTSGRDWLADPCALGMCDWDDEVTDLDGWSDAAQCFGMSERLRWHDVELTPEELWAPSIDRLREALLHVVFCAWCPGDV